jgi:hypothetical protein
MKGSMAAWAGSSLHSLGRGDEDIRAEENHSGEGGTVEIENAYYLVAVNSRNGAIVKLFDKKSGINLNLGEHPSEASVREFSDNSHGDVMVHQPFSAARREAFPVKVTVPSERLAIIEEV